MITPLSPAERESLQDDLELERRALERLDEHPPLRGLEGERARRVELARAEILRLERWLGQT